MQRSHTSKAFTLIELLVVIAIIAILAAILFPVFAQAKLAAKKAQTISNAKQIGTSMAIYTSDYDDLMPLASVPDLSSPVVRYRSNCFLPLAPAGWANPSGTCNNAAEDALVWHNSMQPYMKNWNILDSGASISQNFPFVPATPGRTGNRVNFSMNGLLQYVSSTNIAAPSQLTLLWSGWGNWSPNGAAFASPILRCGGTGVCQFNPGGQPQPDSPAGLPQIVNFTTAGPSYTGFGRGQVHVFADTSARMVNYGNGNQSPFPASTNSPVTWQFLDDQGRVPASPGAFIRGMGGLRGANYIAAFTPDNTFQN